MTTYIIRRLIQSLFVLILVTIIIFFTMRLLPGDPIFMLLTKSQTDTYSEEQLEILRHEAGLDRTIIAQYFDWMGGLAHGDLGQSILTKNSVSAELARRIPITLNLGLAAFVIAIILGVPAGILCAVRRGSWLDTIITTLANIGITIPQFWLAILLMYTFALSLGWLPLSGYTSPFEDFGLNIRRIIMPVTCLALFPLAGIARQTRSAMLEVMRQDYIRTAWSKGLREWQVIIKHALKNGFIPIITLSGMQLSIILGGSVFIETVFVIPGIGSLAVNSVNNQDYPYVQGITLMIAVAVLFINLLVDLTYGWIDPRIRYM